MNFEDILYEVRNGVAWITINRPEKMNSFRGQTCDELIKALNKAGYDRSVGAIVLAGAGVNIFNCSFSRIHSRTTITRATSASCNSAIGRYC